MGEADTNILTKLKSLIAVWAVFVALVKAEIRCYCNQPSCVSTGYMCRSTAGTCFTELFSYSTDLSKSRHGCLELLTPKKRAQCRPPTATIESLPAAICCREDMCNYMTTMDLNIKALTNGTGSFDYTKERHAYETALQQDVWFKAAVIAVPIAGGFILILLILLATRMLRQDSKRQRQLLELRQQQQRLCSAKPQLPISEPCSSHSNCGFGRSQQKPNHACDSWHAYAINDGQYVYEKRTSCGARLLPWPKVHRQKPSTHV